MDSFAGLKELRFDARDAMLLLGGFVAIIIIVSVIKLTTGYAVSATEMKVGVTAMLGLPLARRAVFGPPPARKVRSGAHWSLLSITSLFVMLGAFVAVVAAGSSVLGLVEDVDPLLGAAYAAERHQMLFGRLEWSVATAVILGAMASLGLEARFERPIRSHKEPETSSSPASRPPGRDAA